MDENTDPYAVTEIKLQLQPEQIAMFLINGAYRAAGKEMTFVEDAIYTLRIRQAAGEGVTDPDQIAMRALEMEGWKPCYVTRGEIGYISIEEAGQSTLN